MVKIRLFPILILFLGLVVTFAISYSAFLDQRKLENQSFESFCLTFEGKIQKQLLANAQILYSSAAFISSSDTISREEWREFQFLNKSHNELPGIQGIGYSVIVDKKNVPRFEDQIQKEGFPNFKISPDNERDFYSSVIYLEPNSERNLQALGYDGYTEPIRRNTMDHAWKNDMATISDKIILVQDSGKVNRSGIIIFAPVFNKGYTNLKDESRKSALMGWVFSTYRMSDFMQSFLGHWDYKTLWLKIYDDQLLVPNNLMFDSDFNSAIQRTDQAVQNLNIPLNFNGNRWTLEFARYKDEHSFLPTRVIFIILNGFIISVLLFILALSLIGARTRTMQIQKLNDELKSVNLNKDRFISLLAHDLKSPFNSLLGFSELLVENFDAFTESEKKDCINSIYTSAQISYLLLDELLMWARVQSDQFPYKPEKMNLNNLCKSLITYHELIAKKKNISVNFDDSEVVFVLADELMLKTILRNLLVNAIKFTKENGSVKVDVSKTEENAIISVSDTGIGMLPEEISSLFDITKLKSKAGTANEKGTGLGLLLCKDMVAKHGGKIWVESTIGEGSIFRFTLPLSK